jgi:hypothetical protein
VQVAELLDAYEEMNSAACIFQAHWYHAYPEYWLEGVNDVAYIEALAALPARNPILAGEAYKMFAESPDPRDRRAIAIYLTKLCLADRVAGLELWDHLIRDPDDWTRDDAYREIASEHFGTPSLDGSAYDE